MTGTTRRQLLRSSAVLASLAAASGALGAAGGATAAASAISNPLTPPTSGLIPVAFPISDGAVLIDFAGPWEVFLNASMVGADGAMDMSGRHGFQPYTVAEKSAPVETYGGMKIVPDHTFDNAPPPRLIVIPAQSGHTAAAKEWIRKSAQGADLTMSVCTGAFVLAKTGLLSGKFATTHHGSYADLAMQYPDIKVKRGFRFVEDGNIASAGGLTCGVDLAFHIVERYFGRTAAQQTALNMEYQGRGWLDSSGADNAVYAQAFTGNVCPVCGMPVSAASSPGSTYHGHSYYFCSSGHKALFDRSPDAILQLASGG